MPQYMQPPIRGYGQTPMSVVFVLFIDQHDLISEANRVHVNFFCHKKKKSINIYGRRFASDFVRGKGSNERTQCKYEREEERFIL